MAEAVRIAMLGWGSLLWEPHTAFDEAHGPWAPDGPVLSLEFSRISSSRLGALTLVIDAEHGQMTSVSYCMSKRNNIDDTIADLRCREGTTLKNIGFVQTNPDRSRCRDKASFGAIAAWAKQVSMDAAVWTDLRSNFETVCNKPFCLEAAIAHIQNLDPEAKAMAAEYIWRAPTFVKTALRRELEGQPWFGAKCRAERSL